MCEGSAKAMRRPLSHGSRRHTCVLGVALEHLVDGVPLYASIETEPCASTSASYLNADQFVYSGGLV